MTEQIIGKDGALARIKNLLSTSSDRTLVGIVGKPGAGKSTLSAYLLEQIKSSQLSIVPMDGYHLSNFVLKALGRDQRKGAPDTFDVVGFATLLRRIKSEKNEDIYYPIFDRTIEESIAAQGVVSKETAIVIVEGNYLLHGQDGWEQVVELLDEIWFIDVDDELRLQRLINRHIAFGKSPDLAEKWARGSDEINAQIIAAGRDRAHAVINIRE